MVRRKCWSTSSPERRCPTKGEVLVRDHSTAAIADGDEWLASLDRFGIVSPRAVLLDAATLLQNLAMPFTLDIDPIPLPESLTCSGAWEGMRVFPADRMNAPIAQLSPGDPHPRASGARGGARPASADPGAPDSRPAAGRSAPVRGGPGTCRERPIARDADHLRGRGVHCRGSDPQLRRSMERRGELAVRPPGSASPRLMRSMQNAQCRNTFLH